MDKTRRTILTIDADDRGKETDYELSVTGDFASDREGVIKVIANLMGKNMDFGTAIFLAVGEFARAFGVTDDDLAEAVVSAKRECMRVQKAKEKQPDMPLTIRIRPNKTKS